MFTAAIYSGECLLCIDSTILPYKNKYKCEAEESTRPAEPPECSGRICKLTHHVITLACDDVGIKYNEALLALAWQGDSYVVRLQGFPGTFPVEVS